MKKVAYLTMMFVALTLMSFSCSKDDDDPIVDEGLITLTELDGSWNFQKYSNTGIADITPATTCEDIAINPITVDKRWIKLSLNIHNDDGYYCDLIDACDAPVLNNKLTLDAVNDEISLDNGLVWKINSYNKTTNVLVLKLLKPVSDTDYILDGGTYTLKKQ